MKKTIFTLILSVLGLFMSAQQDLYFKIREAVSLANPAVTFENKLLAINVWSLDNAESREANKGFEKAYKVYEYAKLKGGLRGIVAVAVNLDELSGVATIAFNKDGATKLISLKASDIKGIESTGFSNVVYDSNGIVVYKNLPAAKVFESINQLITR